jgi:hypothetical protein
MNQMKRDCDFCKGSGIITPAIVDAKTWMGPWSYMCDAHNKVEGTGIAGYTNILADIGKKKETN